MKFNVTYNVRFTEWFSIKLKLVEWEFTVPGGWRGQWPGTADEAWHQRRRDGGGGDRCWTPPSQAPTLHFDSTQNPCTNTNTVHLFLCSVLWSIWIRHFAAWTWRFFVQDPSWDPWIWCKMSSVATKHYIIYKLIVEILCIHSNPKFFPQSLCASSKLLWVWSTFIAKCFIYHMSLSLSTISCQPPSPPNKGKKLPKQYLSFI